MGAPIAKCGRNRLGTLADSVLCCGRILSYLEQRLIMVASNNAVAPTALG